MCVGEALIKEEAQDLASVSLHSPEETRLTQKNDIQMMCLITGGLERGNQARGHTEGWCAQGQGCAGERSWPCTTVRGVCVCVCVCVKRCPKKARDAS